MRPLRLLLLPATAGAVSSITELRITTGACPANTERIDTVAPWTGDFAPAHAAGGAGGVYLCAGRGGASGITALRAVGATSAAQARCPPGYTPVAGASSSLNLATRGFVRLCVSRDPSLGPALNVLSGVLSDRGDDLAPRGCLDGLTAVSGTDLRPALPPLNMSSCHGYTCDDAEQGALCPEGTPGASDRDWRCCDLKLVSGPKPGSPAPHCNASGPRNMSSCPGYACTNSQQGEICPRDAPGGENGPFRCCNNKIVRNFG